MIARATKDITFAKKLELPVIPHSSEHFSFQDRLLLASHIRRATAIGLAQRADGAHARGHQSAAASIEGISRRQLVAAANDVLRVIDHLESESLAEKK